MSAARTTSHVERKTTSVLGAVANNARQYGIVGALLVIVVAFEILTKGFCSSRTASSRSFSRTRT